MDENYMTNIFVPCDIVMCSRHVLLGTVKIFDSYTIVNCTASVSYDEQDNLVENISKLCPQSSSYVGQSGEWNFSVIGLICEVCDKQRAHNLPGRINYFTKDIYFVLLVDLENRKFCIEKVQLRNQSLDSKQIRIIIYDAKDVMLSCLLLTDSETDSNMNLATNQKMRFAQFLKNTTASAVHLAELSDLTAGPSSSTKSIDKVLYFLPVLFCKTLIFLSLLYEYFYKVSAERVPYSISYILRLSSVGRQMQRRYHHVHQITSAISTEKHLPLSCGNLISSIIFDILCGWTFTFLFWHYCSPSFLLQIALEYTNIVVNELQQILHWLMGVPAGLKLNLPLNTSLGHFFLYHIYLWKTYMTVIKPIFAFVLEGMAVLGLLGLTFVICILNDLLSMATIHIYCFYGYAAKIYGCQTAGLAALWRLFRGKKWNPLRQRIDSYTYDVQQLYVGTLFFTVLTFLLPTVMAYYCVFTSLRIAVLTVQGLITRAINLLSIFPVYVIILRIFNSKLTTGDVFFSVLQEQKVLVLNMKLVQIPLQSVIQRTLPKDVYKELPLSWKMFWDSLIWGKIIYPI